MNPLLLINTSEELSKRKKLWQKIMKNKSYELLKNLKYIENGNKNIYNYEESHKRVNSLQ